MVIESSTKLLYAGKDLISARSRAMHGKDRAQRAELTFSRISSLSKGGVELVFKAIDKKDPIKGQLVKAQELTEGSHKTLLEVIGPDPGSPHAQRAVQTATHAAALLRGDVEFGGARLPAVADRVEQNLARLHEILTEIHETTEDAALGSERIQDGLGEVAGENGPLDMAAHHLKLFRRQI